MEQDQAADDLDRVRIPFRWVHLKTLYLQQKLLSTGFFVSIVIGRKEVNELLVWHRLKEIIWSLK